MTPCSLAVTNVSGELPVFTLTAQQLHSLEVESADFSTVRSAAAAPPQEVQYVRPEFLHTVYPKDGIVAFLRPVCLYVPN